MMVIMAYITPCSLTWKLQFVFFGKGFIFETNFNFDHKIDLNSDQYEKASY